jgi:hypothetical protein
LDPLPVCLAIDIEPEARLLRRRHPEPLVGFEKLLPSFRVHATSHSANSGFAESRIRFAGKLATTIKDDPRTNRYYFRDLVAPRFFQVCLDDYVRAISARDWPSARAAYRGMRHFGRQRRYRPGWRMTVIRNPRLFRVMLNMHDRLPGGLRLTKNPVLRPN